MDYTAIITPIPRAKQTPIPRSSGYSERVVGGEMVLGKLPVPGRATNLDYSRARN